MADDPTETIVADAFALYVGETTAAAPTDVTTAMGAGWNLVGLLAQDGIGFTSDPEIRELFSAGYNDATRIVKVREPKRFTAQLQQWNTASFTLAFNGGTVTVATGVATYEPNSDTGLAEKSLTFEFQDGTDIYRLYFPRVQVRSGTQMGFPTGDYTVLPLDVTVLAPAGGGASYKLITNNVTSFVATT